MPFQSEAITMLYEFFTLPLSLFVYDFFGTMHKLSTFLDAGKKLKDIKRNIILFDFFSDPITKSLNKSLTELFARGFSA